MGNFRLQTDGHCGWWSVGELQVSAEVKVVSGSVDVLGSSMEAIYDFSQSNVCTVYAMGNFVM